ncbi:Imm21 family immunity protein [Streptomyces albogriseolus]|uniref:Imm21 family immunity protein n=1 Tax=Streptomyces albogriseolus TaxID=1887 RepID=UPI0033A5F433
MGGPPIVIPVSALPDWHGCTQPGVISVGNRGAKALLLGDEPATTRFVSEHNLLLRWLAADRETELRDAAEAVLTDPKPLGRSAAPGRRTVRPS